MPKVNQSPVPAFRNIARPYPARPRKGWHRGVELTVLDRGDPGSQSFTYPGTPENIVYDKTLYAELRMWVQKKSAQADSGENTDMNAGVRPPFSTDPAISAPLPPSPNYSKSVEAKRKNCVCIIAFDYFSMRSEMTLTDFGTVNGLSKGGRDGIGCHGVTDRIKNAIFKFYKIDYDSLKEQLSMRGVLKSQCVSPSGKVNIEGLDAILKQQTHFGLADA